MRALKVLKMLPRSLPMRLLPTPRAQRLLATTPSQPTEGAAEGIQPAETPAQ